MNDINHILLGLLAVKSYFILITFLAERHIQAQSYVQSSFTALGLHCEEVHTVSVPPLYEQLQSARDALQIQLVGHAGRISGEEMCVSSMNELMMKEFLKLMRLRLCAQQAHFYRCVSRRVFAGIEQGKYVYFAGDDKEWNGLVFDSKDDAWDVGYDDFMAGRPTAVYVGQIGEEVDFAPVEAPGWI